MEIKQPLSEDDQEIIMNFRQAYREWREATLREGLAEGRLEAQREIIQSLLAAKFGELDPSLERVVDALLQLSPQEYTRLLLELSKEELIERFDQEAQS